MSIDLRENLFRITFFSDACNQEKRLYAYNTTSNNMHNFTLRSMATKIQISKE